jgi:hypothetical protein
MGLKMLEKGMNGATPTVHGAMNRVADTNNRRGIATA